MQYEVIDAVGANGVRLRLEFVWRNDRFVQEISIIRTSGFALPVLQSIEGSPHADWPPSPPFQSVSITELTDGRAAALLVGMAGGSHWSASIETLKDEATLRFDVACRIHGLSRGLGNRYSCHTDDTRVYVAADESYAEIRGKDASVIIVPDRSLSKLSGEVAGQIGIVPIEETKPNTRTVRWKFDVLVREEVGR